MPIIWHVGLPYLQRYETVLTSHDYKYQSVLKLDIGLGNL